ncbi:MAG: hypothetical protein OER90_11890 [Gemmatimonadota bacterium]|nr:hypothetical protein [Gemmatimonadota bacterium]
MTAIPVALQLAAASTALGQDATYSLYPGSVLRITVANGDYVSGALFRSDKQGIVVRRDGDTVRVAWGEVQRLEIARARRSATPIRKGATVGAVIGLLAGAGSALFCSSFSVMGSRPDPCPEAIPLGLVAGLAVGSAVGAVIGGASRKGQWKEIPLGRIRASLMPRPDGVGLRARITF